jgi:hypothetical protein
MCCEIRGGWWRGRKAGEGKIEEESSNLLSLVAGFGWPLEPLSALGLREKMGCVVV